MLPIQVFQDTMIQHFQRDLPFEQLLPCHGKTSNLEHSDQCHSVSTSTTKHVIWSFSYGSCTLVWISSQMKLETRSSYLQLPHVEDLTPIVTHLSQSRFPQTGRIHTLQLTLQKRLRQVIT